ncbi:MAG: hypothetical protein ACI4KA_03160 [Oscillospiraceae bacterium]
MKRLFSLMLASAMLITVSGCSAKDVVIIEEDIMAPDSMAGAGASPAEPTRTTGAGSGVMEDSASLIKGITGDDCAEYDYALTDGAFAPAMDGADGGYFAEIGVSPEYIENYIPPEAGLLTGGEWRDNDHWNDWVSLYQSHPEWNYYHDIWKVAFTNRHEVIVTAGGVPVEGVVVKQSDGAVNSAVTDNRGRAYLYFENSNGDTECEITAEYGGVSKSITADLKGDSSLTIDLGEIQQNRKKSLDLMLMIDTTGSMCDELIYLQTELDDVIKRVKNDNPNLDIRVSVNFYRDEQDEYVIRSFDFTNNITDALNDLAQQYADGGGDFPEAVHTALNNALNEHSWAEDSTKLMFLVLDAPPHEDLQVVAEVNKHIAQAAENGIRIIPVASSGIDKSTEYLLRTMAFMTGGTYTFLTNDSGIGGDHIEPTIGDYQVESLNDMMVRIVNDYLAAPTA